MYAAKGLFRHLWRLGLGSFTLSLGVFAWAVGFTSADGPQAEDRLTEPADPSVAEPISKAPRPWVVVGGSGDSQPGKTSAATESMSAPDEEFVAASPEDPVVFSPEEKIVEVLAPARWTGTHWERSSRTFFFREPLEKRGAWHSGD